VTGPLLGRLGRARIPVAAALAALAVAAGLRAVAPAEAAAVPVLAAARDLPAGALLDDDALTTVPVLPEAVPEGALTSPDDAVGARTAGAVRAGEALTDVRLLGAGLLPPGDDVAVPVRVAEPAVAGLLRPGDRVDVLAASPEGGEAARVVVSDVAVLAVPEPDQLADGALVVLAASPGGAARLAAAAVSSRLSVAVRGR
jgi:Flp pilus assembly protein CpaB